MFLSLLQFFATKFLVLALHLESGSFPRPLSAQEEAEVFAALRAGDPAAREKLIRHNLRLVAHIVKKYYALPGDQDDLISIGTIGLMKAVDTFDSDRRARFSTYASRCIENEIRMQFRRNRKTGGTVSLQEALESDGDSALTLADVLQDSFCMEDTCETQDDIRRMRQLLDGLPARERQIILLRYGLSGQPPLTQLETAKLLDISRSYVSRLETHALELLRQRWDVPSTKQRRGERCAHPCAMQSAIQNFQLQFVQLFKSIQSIQRFHQLLFGKTRRQAQRVQKLCLALGAARPAGKPPLVEVGIGDLPSFRAGRCGTRLSAKGIPQRLQNNGIVHALDPQQALLAGLLLALFLAVDRGHVSLNHILFSHQIGDVGADAEACRVRIREQDQAVFLRQRFEQLLALFVAVNAKSIRQQNHGIG